MIEQVGDWMATSARVVALTGAGVSTASGIPDFRGPQGLWTRDPAAERLSSIDAWIGDREVRHTGWQRRLAARDHVRVPNDAHRALVRLERLGRLDLLVTQNIDGLHRDAGTSDDRLIEIHGSERDVTCLDCGVRIPMGDVLRRVADGDVDPHCGDCGGLLKAATISFGQQLVADDLERAFGAAAGCEVLLAAGTSLAVYPVAHLPEIAKDAGARVVIVNAEPTPMDALADAVFHADAGATLAAIADAVGLRIDR